MAELNWSDAQWQKVRDCVTESFGKVERRGERIPTNATGHLQAERRQSAMNVSYKRPAHLPHSHPQRRSRCREPSACEPDCETLSSRANRLLTRRWPTPGSRFGARRTFLRRKRIEIVFEGFSRGYS